MATINSFLLLESGAPNKLHLEDDTSHLILWSDSVSDEVMLTLQPRDITLTLDSRPGPALTLPPRDISLTLDARDISLTVKPRDISLTLKEKNR